MAVLIGPSFPVELEVAGLLGLPFAWTDQAVFTWDPAMTQAQIDAVLAVYAVHDPTAPGPPPTLPPLTMIGLKTVLVAVAANAAVPMPVRHRAQDILDVLNAG